MKILSLNGEWALQQSGQTEIIPATVPGCVHTDLLANERIPDPYFRDNELRVMWVGEADWICRRGFVTDEEFLNHDRLLLRCEGLDTLASVTLNGRKIGEANNQFRVWEWDIKNDLKVGENEIEIFFHSPVKYLREKENRERYLHAWGVGDHKISGGSWIRKSPCNFGWDWGPQLATSGIWRDIQLLGFSTARLRDVHILQDHRDHAVQIAVRVQADCVEPVPLSAEIQVLLDNEVVARGRAALTGDSGELELAIPDPELWWPAGMGAQRLYHVRVLLFDNQDNLLDQDDRRIGLRVLSLERHADQWGESFYFAVNGVPFFAKGANWIPADQFVTRLTRADYARLLKDAVVANMNMLRVWGGGIYEQDGFYDLCDELGICVWQDFIFACATYPAFDAEFMENVRIEAEENVRRIRHHACLALWCGNNELEQGLVGDEWTDFTMSWEDYSRLFDRLLRDIVAAHDPQRDYWPGSPHTPRSNRLNWNEPGSGDAHLWDVWHGRQPFEFYRTTNHRFVSEFGFQSFPEPKTVYTYTNPEDHNITGYIMEHHQRSGIGNSAIIHYMLDWFRLPTSFEMTLWLSQILQGMAIKYAIEHWRRGMPRSMGALYWQLNDCWQVASWSSIDYFGRWKALHYMAKEFYAPLLISGVEDRDDGTVDAHITSDLRQDTEGIVRWILTDTDGKTLESGEQEMRIPGQMSQKVMTLDFRRQIEAVGERNLLLWLELLHNGEIVSSNLVLFARPKHLELRGPEITVRLKRFADGKYKMTLTGDKPALWVWIEAPAQDARLSRNFFHLRPGQPVSVMMEMDGHFEPEKLLVRSLVDTYA